MRKYQRAIYRAYAEKHNLKASKFVYDSWHNYQVRRVGYRVRMANVRHGTKPKRNWKIVA